MEKQKRYLSCMKASSLGLYILLFITMFQDVEERITAKLEITSFWGMLIAGIGLGIPVIVYILRLKNERSKESFLRIHTGCMVLLILTIINLMDGRIVSGLFYFLVRFTLGWIYQYLYSAICEWIIGLFWKIALGIIIITILLLLYFAVTYSIADPQCPVLAFFRSILEVLSEDTGDSGKRTVQSKDSGSSDVIGTIVAGMLINEAIKSEVERQEIIRRDPMSEFRP